MREKQIYYIEYIILVFNILAVISVTGFIFITTELICIDFNAGQFMAKVAAIPWNPQKLFWGIVFLCIVLIISYFIRISSSVNSKYRSVMWLVDLVVSCLIIFFMDFNYNGILLWVFTSLISYRRENNGVYTFIGLGVLGYIFTDHLLLSLSYKLFSVTDYIKYYDVYIQKYLLGIYNLMNSLSVLLFLVFCVCIIIRQKGTIEAIQNLYKKLSAANMDLQEANIKLEEYANIKGKMGETKERNRLAREIHDTLGHTLTGLSTGIDACITMMDSSPEATKEQLNMLSQVARDGIKEVRRSVNELRPDTLERFSLEYAIRKMINEMNCLTSTNVKFTCSFDNLQFDEDEENIIYRVIQESITNSIRHGRANNISILIDKKDNDIIIEIKDDGVGCGNLNKGFGLHHIVERVEMLQGKVTFKGDSGFATKVVLPLRWRVKNG